MPNVHKRVLINKMADRFNDSQENVKRIIDCFSGELLTSLKQGHDLEFRGFGVFRVKERPARRGINPKTQERVDIKPKRHVHFKMGTEMKELVRKRT